jgi:ubiquinone/menaquinone biosynthesis C-methylase UbiE
MACGRGGPGLWVAADCNTRLIGVDLAETAVTAARSRAQRAGFRDRATFHVGTFEDSGLNQASIDAAMSVDSLLFARDKAAAIGEFARVLRPGGRLVVTTWDYHRQPNGRPLASRRSPPAPRGGRLCDRRLRGDRLVAGPALPRQ